MAKTRAKPKAGRRNDRATAIATLRRAREEFVRVAEELSKPVDQNRLRAVLALLDI